MLKLVALLMLATYATAAPSLLGIGGNSKTGLLGGLLGGVTGIVGNVTGAVADVVGGLGSAVANGGQQLALGSILAAPVKLVDGLIADERNSVNQQLKAIDQQLEKYTNDLNKIVNRIDPNSLTNKSILARMITNLQTERARLVNVLIKLDKLNVSNVVGDIVQRIKQSVSEGHAIRDLNTLIDEAEANLIAGVHAVGHELPQTRQNEQLILNIDVAVGNIFAKIKSWSNKLNSITN